MSFLPGFAMGFIAAGASGGATATYHTLLEDNTSGTSATFSNVNVGTGSKLVVVGAFTGLSENPTTVTLNGNAMTVTSATTNEARLYYLRATLDATDTIVVNASSTTDEIWAGVWTVEGNASDTPADTQQATSGGPLTLTAGHCAIAVIDNAGITWTGATEDFDAGTSPGKSGAHVNNIGVSGVTLNTNDSSGLMFAASWS